MDRERNVNANERLPGGDCFLMMYVFRYHS